MMRVFLAALFLPATSSAWAQSQPSASPNANPHAFDYDRQGPVDVQVPAYLVVPPGPGPFALQMMLSLYVTLGVAHASVMGVQIFRNLIPRHELVGVIVLVIVGLTLIVLAPGKAPVAAS